MCVCFLFCRIPFIFSRTVSHFFNLFRSDHEVAWLKKVLNSEIVIVVDHVDHEIVILNCRIYPSVENNVCNLSVDSNFQILFFDSILCGFFVKCVFTSRISKWKGPRYGADGFGELISSDIFLWFRNSDVWFFSIIVIV